MSLLNAEIQKQVREAFADLSAPVKLIVFSQGEGGALECDMCTEARQLAEEVGELSDKITVEVHDLVGEADLARSLGVDKLPAMALLRDGPEPKDYGIRFYGLPSGYEFASLIESIRMVSRGEAELSAETMQQLARLTKPVHIQVYITPTCPYCPRAVLLAYQLAMASDLVTADMVEATEFPQLANRYQVYGVPRTVINDVIHIEGAVPEAALVSRLMTVLNDAEMDKLLKRWQAVAHLETEPSLN